MEQVCGIVKSLFHKFSKITLLNTSTRTFLEINYKWKIYKWGRGCKIGSLTMYKHFLIGTPNIIN